MSPACFHAVRARRRTFGGCIGSDGELAHIPVEEARARGKLRADVLVPNPAAVVRITGIIP